MIMDSKKKSYTLSKYVIDMEKGGDKE